MVELGERLRSHFFGHNGDQTGIVEGCERNRGLGDCNLTVCAFSLRVTVFHPASSQTFCLIYTLSCPLGPLTVLSSTFLQFRIRNYHGLLHPPHIPTLRSPIPNRQAFCGFVIGTFPGYSENNVINNEPFAKVNCNALIEMESVENIEVRQHCYFSFYKEEHCIDDKPLAVAGSNMRQDLDPNIKYYVCGLIP
ncbi:hypothetical protein P280DRAFT_85849 [Massarina eburnea CBS 473.64]|uniref:Uncharacterized protein n=1 Tax=Massarina eburnea CBS 473.64 TaxID=1395130 RepID=A0A6A6RUH5_9PLEO|nr:hypothetical protein P280DRAFT_85849 [Massarina eburnea CBS 473.64]